MIPNKAPPIRVLIVDDNADTRDMYAAYLAFAGMDVATAEDGHAGVLKAIEWSPDVVVMDWAMPIVDGSQATLTLKKDPRTSHIVVVILTAYGDQARAAAEAAGADALCAKPCGMQELVEVIKRRTVQRRESRAVR
jgi:two-component system, cell cycle response regulator DivK